MLKDDQRLRVNVCVKMTRNDANLIQDEGKRRGYESTGAFLRDLLLNSLSLPTQSTLLLESVLRVEFLLTESFKVFAPDPRDRAEVEELQKRAEAISGDLLKKFVARRSDKSEVGKGSHGD